MRGYTLLELVIVLVIVSILAAFIGPVLVTAVGTYDTTTRNLEAFNKMRYAMERMAREIRQARREPTDTRNYDIVAMSDSAIEFCKPDNTRVRIARSGAEVTLGYAAGTPTACTGAPTNPTLTDAVNAFCLNYCRFDVPPGTIVCTRTHLPTLCTATGIAVDKTNVAFVEISMTLTDAELGNFDNRMRVDLRIPR